MRKNLIPREKRTVEINYPENESGEGIPIIYIRYWKNVIVYVGETDNYYKGRHLRPKCTDAYGGINSTSEERLERMNWDNTSFIRILNAPINTMDRRRWEARLICWLNPKLQKVGQYLHKAKLDFKSKKDAEIIMDFNDAKAVRRAVRIKEHFEEGVKYYKKWQRRPASFPEKVVQENMERGERTALNYMKEMFKHEANLQASMYQIGLGAKPTFFPTHPKIVERIHEVYQSMIEKLEKVTEHNKKELHEME